MSSVGGSNPKTLLNECNYKEWWMLTEDFLRGLDYLGYARGDEDVPEPLAIPCYKKKKPSLSPSTGEAGPLRKGKEKEIQSDADNADNHDDDGENNYESNRE
jgi:hypothetical protein